MKTETQIVTEHPGTSPATAHPSAPDVTAKKRILLADDSPQIRESLSKVLRKADYHVALVAQGGQALDRVLAEEFDLLLLDLNMPGMDGWETLDLLARLKPQLPVLIITAQPDQRDWAQAEGARALMEKPLDLPTLLQTIRELTAQPQKRNPVTRPPARERFRFAAPERQPFRFSESRQRWQTD